MHEPTPAPRSVAPLAHPIPFVGRERELALLASLLSAGSRPARGQLVLISGEPGIGKTRLVHEALAALPEVPPTTWGRCWESGGAPAHWPWIQALSAAWRDAASDPSRHLGEAERDALAALLPNLVPPRPGRARLLETLPGDALAARFQIFVAVAALLRALGRDAGSGRRVIVLEDLHAADLSSLFLLEFLAAELPSLDLVIIGTLRDAEPRIPPEARLILARLQASAYAIALPRLEREHVHALVRHAHGDASEHALSRAVDTIQEATFGNPLFVEGVLRSLSPSSLGHALELQVPLALRDLIRQRVGALPAELRDLLERAAVVGRDFATEVLAAALGSSAGVLQSHLDAACAAGVLQSRGRGRYAFTHGLVRDTLYRDLPAERRAALHLEIARALETLDPGALETPVAELAHHYLEAGGEASARALALSLAAAESALEALAYEDAIALLERARRTLAATTRDPRVRAELLLAEGLARVRADQGARGTTLCAQAAELARTLGDGDLFARAALAYGAEFTFGRTDLVLVRLLEEALARLDGAAIMRARLFARLASALQPASDPGRAVAMARQAIAMVGDGDDPAARLAVIHTAMSALVDFVSARERVALNLESERLAEQLGDRPKLLRARARLVFDQLELADLDAAERAFEGYRSLVHALGSARSRWSLPLFEGMRAAMQGRFAEDLAAIDEAEVAGASAGDPSRHWILVCHRLALYRTMERHDDVRALVPEVRAAFGVAPAAHAWGEVLAAAALARAGELEAARARIEHGEITAFVDKADNASLGLLAEAVALAGSPEAAAIVRARLLPLSGMLLSYGMMGIAAEGPFDRQLGLLADRLGLADEAERHFGDAVALCRRFDLRPHLARTLLEHARSLAPRDPARARVTLDEAEAIAQALALGGLAEPLAAVRAMIAPTRVAETSPAPAAPRAEVAVTLERSGELWVLRGLGAVVHLKDSRGAQILKHLLDHPGTSLHATELVSGPGSALPRSGDAGAHLDREAVARYRERLREIEDDLAEAERFADAERASRLGDERAFLAAELARALGLGGRERKASSNAERARVTVQKRIKDVLKKVDERAPELARHLAAAIHTGQLCVYHPDGRRI